MTWFRYECGFASHPAGRAAGLKGRALWTEGLDHSTVHLTDGRIDKGMLPLLAAAAQIGTGTAEARKLVEIGLWVDMGDHWQIPNVENYQPPRATVEAVKAKKGRAGAEGNHKRWHVDRGITIEDCEWCHPNRKPIAPCDEDAIAKGSPRHDHEHVNGCDPATTTIRGLSAASRVVKVTRAIAESRLERQRDREIIEDEERYLVGIANNVRAELGDQIAAVCALEFGVLQHTTIADLVTLVLGDYEGAA